MKLKKLSMLTVLALSQVASAIPVSAQSVVTNAPQETEMSEVLEQSLVAPEAESADAANVTSDGSQDNGQEESGENNAGTAPEQGSDNSNGSQDAEGTNETGSSETTETAPAVSSNELILHFNSTKMEQGGKVYNAPQPMQVKKGVSYVPIRALVDRVGYKVSYDKSTKETVIISGTNELRFKTDSSKYTVNGVTKTMKGTSFQTKNTFMVPLTAITQALDISYKVDNVGKRIIMNLSVKPVAKFTINEKEIFAGQTTVTYTTEASSPKGLEIINERWEGRQDVFAQAGEYTITYSVQDASGTWSDPYSQTINVLQPNLPPVALFTTDKDEYRMGEYVTITDQSTDDGQIVKHDWNNKAYAFFTPGPKTISLTVTDNKGLSSTFEKTVIVTGETLYSQDDFNRLLMPAGEKFTFDGSNVPALPKINYSYYDEPSTLIRSNSPETVNSEGIVYRETSSGDTRFMIHHVNNVGKNVKMYVVATNTNFDTATITTENLGFAGPTGIATAAGKKSVYNYFESMQNGSKRSKLTLEPGESKLVMTELSKTRMKQGDVISLFSDLNSDYPIQYDVIMIDEKLDPLAVLDELPILDRDGVHNRGTYPNSTRVIRYSQYVGDSAQRMALGDNQDDPNLTGMDPMLGVEASNAGNFGVLYKITFDNVAANTLISFNPRGGKYSGYAMVNGNITAIYSAGQVSAPNEQAVLYRTGEYNQKVEILLTAAPGSNLPVNLLFTPLPEVKE
ncbi:stalk domain-containing protein [Neobacillus mesonae]|nr:stalk domain-containing protein [Neobacillus mesonae]